jgi:hypothetical protein
LALLTFVHRHESLDILLLLLLLLDQILMNLIQLDCVCDLLLLLMMLLEDIYRPPNDR